MFGICKLGRVNLWVLAYLEFRGLEGVVCSFPKGPEQHGKANGQPASCSQRIIAVDFCLKCSICTEERKNRGMNDESRHEPQKPGLRIRGLSVFS